MLLQIHKRPGCIRLKDETGKAVAEMYRVSPCAKAKVYLPATGEEAAMAVVQEGAKEHYVLGSAEHPLAQADPEAQTLHFAPALANLRRADMRSAGCRWMLEVQKDLSVLVLESDRVVGEISSFEDLRPQRMALPENTPPALCAACYLFAENLIHESDLEVV